jgi:hypothetical protein
MQLFFVFLAALCVCLPLLAVAGDGGEMTGRFVGGPCEYKAIEGRATVIEVKNAPADAYNCRDAVEVIYTFVPDDPSAEDSYRFADYPDSHLSFTLGAGMNPPRQWAKRKGLVPGSRHRCIRKEIVTGTCVPVTHVFPDIDTTGWEQECYKTGSQK